jgi:hypothetical protein
MLLLFITERNHKVAVMYAVLITLVLTITEVAELLLLAAAEILLTLFLQEIS